MGYLYHFLLSVGTPAENLAYIVVEPPRHGRLLVAGRRVSRSFTQVPDTRVSNNLRHDTSLTALFPGLPG